MDGISSAVLEKLCALGDPGRYFVLSEEDFFEAFPEGCARDGAALKRAVDGLAAEGYIDVKYSCGNMYCAALIKPYEECAEAENEAAEPLPERGKTEHISAFWGALAGGALGSAVVSAVWLLINLC